MGPLWDTTKPKRYEPTPSLEDTEGNSAIIFIKIISAVNILAGIILAIIIIKKLEAPINILAGIIVFVFSLFQSALLFVIAVLVQNVLFIRMKLYEQPKEQNKTS